MADRRRRRGSGRGPGRAGPGRLGRGPRPRRASGAIPASYPRRRRPAALRVAGAWERATETAARPPRPDLRQPDFPDRPALAGPSPGTPQARSLSGPRRLPPVAARQYFALVAAVVAEGPCTATTTSSTTRRRGGRCSGLEAALRSCGWTLDEWSRARIRRNSRGRPGRRRAELDDHDGPGLERERDEPRERTRAASRLEHDFGDIFPDQPPNASSTRTTRSLRSAASRRTPRYSSRSVMSPRRRIMAVARAGQGGTVAPTRGSWRASAASPSSASRAAGGRASGSSSGLEMLAGLRDARLDAVVGVRCRGPKSVWCQYLAGGTLEAACTARRRRRRRDPPVCAVRCRRRHYRHCAHRDTNEAIVHGDIKSANIADARARRSRTLAWRGAWRATPAHDDAGRVEGYLDPTISRTGAGTDVGRVLVAAWCCSNC